MEIFKMKYAWDLLQNNHVVGVVNSRRGGLDKIKIVMS